MTPRPKVEYPFLLHGWFLWHDKFREILNTRRPQVCVELGTWIGASATFTANIIKEWGGTLTCVDVWDGLYRVGEDADVKRLAPEAYDRFCSNVWHMGLQHTITPIKSRSWLVAEMHPLVDFLYVDGGHEFEDVNQDLHAWWPRMSMGGLMLGDDFGMPGVEQGWKQFASRNGLEMKNEGQLVWISK